MKRFIKLTFRILFTIIFLLCVKTGTAQEEESISADRPDQTEATYILPKKHFQVSEGFLGTQKTLQNDFLLRYGLFKNTEIRTSVSLGSYDDKFQLQPVDFSLKHKISPECGILPSMSFIATATVEKLATKELQTSKIPLEIIFAFNHDIQEKYFIAYNLGASSWFEDLLLTVETGMEVSKKVSFFLEFYANYVKGSIPDQNVDCGLLFLANPLLQIDIAVGTSIMNQNNFFFTAGFSYWFKPKQKNRR